MLQTSSSLKWSLSLRICKGKSFKPDSASNETFLKGSVKQDASNHLQPQMKFFFKDLQMKKLQTRCSLKWSLSSRICNARCFKPTSASNEASLKGSVKQDASNHIQPQMKTFFKELLSKMLQTSSRLKCSVSSRICKGKKLQTRSSLKWSLSWRICKARCFKPASASNEAFLKGSVKQDASNQMQPQMKTFLKDLWSKMLQTSSSLKWSFSVRICKGKSFKPDPTSNEAFLKDL